MDASVFHPERSDSLRFRGRPWVSLVLLTVVLSLAATGCWNTRTGEASVPGIAKFTLPAFPKTGSHKVLSSPAIKLSNCARKFPRNLLS